MKTTQKTFTTAAQAPYVGHLSDNMPTDNVPQIGDTAPDGQPWRKRFTSVEDAAKNARAFAYSRMSQG